MRQTANVGNLALRGRMRSLAVVVVAGIALGSAACASTLVASAVAKKPARPCSGPKTITRGGTYSGCWVSNHKGVAIYIATSQPVTITNSIVKGTSTLVQQSVADVKVTIQRTRFYGLYPGGSGQSGGYTVDITGFDSFVFQHNDIQQKGGIVLRDWSGRSKRPVLVRYNSARNIDGRLTNGRGGYAGEQALPFLQLDKVHNAFGVDISWNDVRNQPNLSAVEDNINIFDSSGVRGSPIDIHDNFIQGAYPFPANARGFSGGGINLADGGGNLERARRNQVLDTTNYGIANSSGTNTAIYGNRVVGSALLPNGAVNPSANVGLISWNQYSAPYGNNSVYDNVSGWMHAGPRPFRNDKFLPDCNHVCSGNVALHRDAREVSRADEKAEQTSWAAKLKKHKITVGV